MLTEVIAAAAAGLAGAGIVQSLAGAVLLRRKLRESAPAPGRLPPITVLKPLCGDEDMLEAALASFCAQDYPQFQIVFGVGNAGDGAIATVHRLRARFPHLPIDLVIDGTRHGRNNKISNLINMFAAARHDLLVIADSDIHAPPDTLRSVAAALKRPGVGLVSTLYTGLPSNRTLTGALGASQINHNFLPGALMARSLGRQDCLGAVMALERRTLQRIGGLRALVDHLADDALLGRLVRGTGLEVTLASAIPATTVPEKRLPALVQHELRWMRTVKSVAPVGFVLGALQYPLFWATLALALAADQALAWAGMLTAWALRAAVTEALDRLLRTPVRLPMWCLPFRDVLSVLTMVASYWSDRVAWRGQETRVTSFSEAVLQPGKG